MPGSPKVVLITGASSGIGRATAALLAQGGYRVFGTSRQPATPTLDGFTLLPLDVTDDESVTRCLETVIARAGRLDVLINNAGTTLPGAVEEIDVDAARALFETNFFGAVRMTRTALPALRAAHGAVVNISSGFGLVGLPFDAYYSASKHALEGWAESLRQEVAPLGVRVLLVEPGYFRSALNGVSRRAAPGLTIYQTPRDRAFALFDRSIREGGDPQQVARAIDHLLSLEHPPLRTPVGRDVTALALGKRLAPEGLFVRGFRSVYGLEDVRLGPRLFWPVLAVAAGVLAVVRRKT